MNCSKCGQKVEDFQKVCNNCGTPVKTVTAAASQNPTNNTTEKSKSKTGSKIVSGIIAVAFLGLGAYNSFEQKGIDQNNDALENFYTGDNQTAIQQLEEAKNQVIGDENKINTLKNLAYIYVTESQIEQAKKTFEEALALCEKDSFDYYLISGEIALLEPNPANAVLNFEKAAVINPDDYQLNNTLALFYIDLEGTAPEYVDYEKALNYAQKAYSVDTSEITKQNLAIANFFMEDYDQTITLLLTSNLKQHPYAAFWLGLAYLGKEDHLNAGTFFQTALDNGAELPQEILDYLNGTETATE
jgi:tetratricopeptide (TPR) repeat protein